MTQDKLDTFTSAAPAAIVILFGGGILTSLSFMLAKRLERRVQLALDEVFDGALSFASNSDHDRHARLGEPHDRC
jgi:hypothetical protein